MVSCVRLCSRPLAVLGTLCMLLFSPRPAAADPLRVTGGTVTMTTNHVSLLTTVAISGDNFRADVFSGDGGSTVLMESAFDALFPGTPHSLSSAAAAPFGGSITFEGITHTVNRSIAGPSIGSGVLVFNTPSFQLPAGQQFIDVSLPFTMSGSLGFANSPTDRLNLELFGSGTAFARASPKIFFGQNGYEIRQLDFVFGATPTPEPATVFLLGLGLAISARRFAGTRTKST